MTRPAQHPFKTYTLELLHFGLRDAATPGERPPEAADGDATGDATGDAVGKATGDAAADRFVARAATALAASGKRDLVLLGYGSGRIAERLAERLARPVANAGPSAAQPPAPAFPGGTRLTVVGLDPGAVQATIQAHLRSGRPGPPLAWWTDDGPCRLLADTSPWAVLLLLAAFGPAPEHALMMRNPEVPAGPARDALTALQRTLLALRRDPGPSPDAPAPPAPTLSVAAILHPDEPGLERFFAQVPPWVHELCVVWDAESVPEHPAAARLDPAVALRQVAHPLELHFAAQRNRMLDLCTGDWVFYLDGDEEPAPGVWAGLPAVLERDRARGGADFWFLPRRTLTGAGDRALVGYGLWPDLQLRLFRRSERLRFRRPVHEVLTGANGPAGILADAPIDHYSRVRKSREELERKLDLFSRAAGGAVAHRLNPAHPSLPLSALPLAGPPPAGPASRGDLTGPASRGDLTGPASRGDEAAPPPRALVRLLLPEIPSKG
ncbi:MAG: hypothetical protein H0S85_07290 [Desulfovibrionaceae bacterium]|jgi:hypothetical protein|nr:hypothetical protein [Desulfovibrionaceae bacterium]